MNLNWPEVKDLTGLDDAKTLFRLANTQFKKAMEFHVLEGFVTENVTSKQAISQCYRHLTRLEADKDRCALMHQKRIDYLEDLQKQLNANTYQVRMMEFGAELSDIYGDLYELEIQKPKKNAARMNEVCWKSIQNGSIFTAIVYSK
jgi:hypothetical protein